MYEFMTSRIFSSSSFGYVRKATLVIYHFESLDFSTVRDHCVHKICMQDISYICISLIYMTSEIDINILNGYHIYGEPQLFYGCHQVVFFMPWINH